MRTINSGILLVNKEAGVTSRQVGNLVSKRLGIKKVGHLGTLDPFATGLLIFALNEGTKVLPFLEDQTKTYVATFKLGYLTSTLDPEGDVLIDEEIAAFSEPKVSQTLKSFVGEITQVPPLTSAIKVAGKRLYEYAHRGESIDVPERQVFIHNLKLIDYIHPFLKIEAEVSKGTYIRTLGEDIAKKLGTHATTVALERTHHGTFFLKDAKKIDDVTLEDIISPSQALAFLPIFKADERLIIDVRNGKDVELKHDAPLLQIHDHYGVLHALCRKNGLKYTPIRGFNL